MSSTPALPEIVCEQTAAPLDVAGGAAAAGSAPGGGGRVGRKSAVLTASWGGWGGARCGGSEW